MSENERRNKKIILSFCGVIVVSVIFLILFGLMPGGLRGITPEEYSVAEAASPGEDTDIIPEENELNYESFSGGGSGDYWWSLLKLLIVFPLILLLAYITSRFFGGRYNPRKNNGMIRLIETQPLNKNNCIYLIGVGKKIVVMAGSGENLSFICEVNEKELDLENVEKSKDLFFRDVLGEKINQIRNLKWKAGQKENVR